MFPLVLAKVPDARLLIVGDGPDLDWAKEYAAALGISRQVEFAGYTTNVAKYLVRSDVHILTSEFEGWCLALGEAWAYGIPSVMFSLPYLEYVQSGKGHIAVKMLDIVAMADAVAELLINQDLRQEMGRGAREVAEEFDRVSVTEEWRQIFEDIETRDNLELPMPVEQELRGLRTLSKVLANRFLSLKTDHADNYVPVLPSQAPLEAPRTARGKRLLRLANVAGAPFVAVNSRLKAALIPDNRLRMIDLSHVGLGDNIMIWTGLFTLLSEGVPLCAPGCVIHVQPVLADLATALFARFGLIVQRGRPKVEISPIYSPLPPGNAKQWWATYIGRDWRMNWVEALDLQKSFPRDGADLSFRGRVRLMISERLLYRRHSWAQATPGYIGYRVWLPLALKNGIYPLVFLAKIKRSLVDMRVIVSAYIDDMTPEDERAAYAGNAAFPTGKSFQTISPTAFSAIQAELGGDFFTCYVQNDSPWKASYESGQIQTTNIADIRDTFRVIKYAGNLLTTDSFTSHVAQLLRDDFVLVLSRDMKEGILHPGCNPQVLANHPPCAPCNYQERYHFESCVAGYKYCLAFDDEKFVKNIARPFKR